MYESSKILKAKMKSVHDQYISRKSFKVDQKVILYNSLLHLFLEKLQSRWSGPFVVQHISSHGEIKIQNPRNGNVFKVNGYQLKPYLELKQEKVEYLDLCDPPPFK